MMQVKIKFFFSCFSHCGNVGGGSAGRGGGKDTKSLVLPPTIQTPLPPSLMEKKWPNSVGRVEAMFAMGTEN